MQSQFILQVQIFMESQHIKNQEFQMIEKVQNSNYKWLSTHKRNENYWMSTKDEIKIRNYLQKISQDQELQVLKQVLKFLDDQPNISPDKIPEITLHYLRNAETENLLKQRINQQKQQQNSPFSRMGSIRNSLRKLSIFSNVESRKIQPNDEKNLLGVPDAGKKPRRSVSFNEEITVIYRPPKN